MIENSMKIEIDAKLENVSVVRVAISSFISNLDITIDEIIDIKTALSEAVTNAIEHGYDESYENLNNKVIIEAYIKDLKKLVEIKVIDYGIGIEDISLALTPEYTTKPEEEHAGMGFTIMETFMNEIIVDSTEKSGTVITLKKILKKRQSNA